MNTVLLLIQIVTGIALTISILLQNSSGGLGNTFGSASYHTKRGVEKGIFYFTIVTAIIFTVSSLVNLA